MAEEAKLSEASESSQGEVLVVGPLPRRVISSDILLLSPESRKGGIAYDIEGWWTFGQQMLRNLGSYLAFSD